MTEAMTTEQEPQRPARYNNVGYDVATLNDQIRELVASNEEIEQENEVLQQRLRNNKRIMRRNERNADKLRAKRQAVAEAAYRIAQIDQP